MNTELPSVDIGYLELWLESFICRYNQSANKQLLANICLGINAIIQHDDFDHITDRHCSYHRMKNYWQWRYQIA